MVTIVITKARLNEKLVCKQLYIHYKHCNKTVSHHSIQAD